MPVPLKDIANTCWFFDYDGSLCPHQEVWESRVYNVDEILSALSAVQKRGAQILWNTGRRVESLGEIDQRLHLYSGYFVHGSVFWDAKTKQEKLLGPVLPEVCKNELQRLTLKHRKLRLELKPTAARIAPLDLRYIHKVLDFVAESHSFVDQKQWHWIVGSRGAELLAKGVDKGSALLAARAQFKGIPVVVGDDLLDKPAAAQAIAAGGYVFLVGEGCGWITEINHKPNQVRFFEKPKDVLDYLELIK